MKIPTYAWVLPRPRKTNKYRGGFPLHFEKKLLDFLHLDPKKHLILHPFGGMAEYGLRVDILRKVRPDVIGDAHYLPFRDNIFDCVIVDPPYSDEYSIKLFGIKQKLNLKKYLQESIRVLKTDGFLVFYHIYPIPCPKGCRWHARILLEHRTFHRLRWVGIFRKGLPERLRLKKSSLEEFI